MTALGIIIVSLLRLYVLVLIIRIIIEMVQSFSRRFDPPVWFMRVAEPMFIITDPPVKALRRLIPPLRMGGVALDLSIIVLFLLLQVAIFAVSMTMLG